MRDILLGFNQILIIATDFHRSPPVSNITEIAGAGLKHTDRYDEANKRFPRL